MLKKDFLLSFISFITLFLVSCGTETAERTEQTMYLGDNGVTIMCPGVGIGKIGVVDGVEYEVVDRELLIQRRDEGKDLSKVCVSNIKDMNEMLSGPPFNQDNIVNWDVSSVTNMNWMFSFSLLNQPIGIWDVSSVINMEGMFNYSKFNQSIENWDISSVTDMTFMFRGSFFNQPIDNWDVSSVTNMYAMFRESQFNQPIGNWDVSSVSEAFYMEFMFFSSPFNQDISLWCVSNISSEPNDFSTGSPLIEENKPVWGTCPSN